jgi:hypothetical protein
VRIKLAIILGLSLAVSTATAGLKYFTHTGGGAEDRKKDTTIFDNSLPYLSNYVNSAFTHIEQFELAYDGGHEKSKKLLKEKFPKTDNLGFTNESLNKIIESYITKIKNGKIKAGDQILLSFDTHGIKAGKDVVSHKIATDPQVYDPKNTFAFNMFSMDKLKELMELTKKNNVKLGILDLGCYSGSSLNLNDSHACIITSTTSDLFSFKGDETFTTEFFKHMAPGRSLEDVFLAARSKENGDRSMPMISTDIGRNINSEIYSKLTPFIHFHTDDSRTGTHANLFEYLASIDSDQKFCKREYDFKQLMESIDNVENLSKSTLKILNYEIFLGTESFGKLKKLLVQYKTKMDGITKEYYSKKRKLYVKENIFFINDKGIKMVAPYSVEAILSSDYSSLYRQEIQKAKPDKTLSSLFKSLAEKREEIIKNKPELLKISDSLNAISSKIKGTTSLAISIAREERRLFDTLYRKKRELEKKSNPCRDFVL